MLSRGGVAGEILVDGDLNGLGRLDESPLLVCAVIRRRFPVGARPTRQARQPEATGAVMEVTKWLKPSISVSRMGDSARVQAATRVNAEQATVELLRHRQTKGAGTDWFYLTPPRHTSTLPKSD
jgi:hypothetical protein